MENNKQNQFLINTTNKAISMILHNGLRKYKAKNSKVGLVALDQQEPLEAKLLNGQKNKKGSVFITRSKEHLNNPTGTLGIVLSSEEATLDHIGMATHWTPNVYNFGEYVDEKRTIIKGHRERNLQQINCFVVDVDTKDVTPGEIVLAAMDKQLDAPTFILETSKGYHVYFVLEEPLFVTNKNDYRCIAVAKRISDNIRKALAEDLPGVDQTCNHFGFFRMPNEKNIVWFQEESTCNLAELIDWSKDQDIGHRRKLFAVLPNKSQSESIQQIGEEWVTEILNLKNIKGESGVIGRDNAMYTLALACYSSRKDEKYAIDLLDEYNSRLAFPMKNQDVRKVIRSAYKGTKKGASREYVEQLLNIYGQGLNTPFSSEVQRGWYKHKKERKDRVRSHFHEWEADIIKYLQAHKESKKGFIYHTQKELCEALNIPRSTLNKVLSNSKKIYRHVVGVGNKKQTGLATLAMLFDYVTSKKAEQSESFVALIREFAPVAARKLLSVLKGRKNQGYQGFEGLLARDGTG